MYKKYDNIIDLCNSNNTYIDIEKIDNLNSKDKRCSNSFMEKTSDKGHIKQAVANYFGMTKDISRSKEEQLKYDRAVLKNLHKRRTCLGVLAEDIDG